jgi:hypothetical protein
MLEQRQEARRIFSYYMLVYDDVTGELIGHWTDISPAGFRLETIKPVHPNSDFRFRVDLSNEIANKTYMVFCAHSRWCHKDEFDSNLYDAGFQLAKLPPDDNRIFTTMFERYGSHDINENFTGDNYTWR